MKAQMLKLADIVTTAGTQIRARIDTDTVSQYAEEMLDGKTKFPPVVVFHDGSAYVLADGFHRVMAASRNGAEEILADIRKGTRSDALKFALGANTSHGLRRTNADKHRSVELALAEWPELSDVELARICAVSANTVKAVRSELEGTSQIAMLTTRIGADGKRRKLPKARDPEPDDDLDELADPKPKQSPEPSERFLEMTDDDVHDYVLTYYHRMFSGLESRYHKLAKEILLAELKK